MLDIKVLGSGSKGNCYVVSDGVTSLMLDCGLPVKQVMKGIGFNPNAITACLVTHSHGDHIKCAEKLAEYGIKIYASEGCFNDVSFPRWAINVLIPLKICRIGDWAVKPFDVEHDTTEPLGFLIESKRTGDKLLYFTDSYYLKYKFKGLNYIMCECNYDVEILKQNIEKGYIPRSLANRLLESHMSIDHLVEMLKSNDLSVCRQIYLLHLSDGNSNEEKFKETVQRLTGVEVIVC